MGKHVMKATSAGTQRAAPRIRLFGDVVYVITALVHSAWKLKDLFN